MRIGAVAITVYGITIGICDGKAAAIWNIKCTELDIFGGLFENLHLFSIQFNDGIVGGTCKGQSEICTLFITNGWEETQH
jgi:hypothetical protein